MFSGQPDLIEQTDTQKKLLGSGALSGKKLLVRTGESNKILGQFRLSKGQLCPAGIGKGL